MTPPREEIIRWTAGLLGEFRSPRRSERRVFDVGLMLLGALFVGPRRAALCRYVGVSEMSFNHARYWLTRAGIWERGLMQYEWLEHDGVTAAVGFTLDCLAGAAQIWRTGHDPVAYRRVEIGEL